MWKRAIFSAFATIGILSMPLCGQSSSTMQEEIRHVVVIMLENRSFDNILAWLYSEKTPPARFIPADTDPHYYGLSDDVLDLYTNVVKDCSGNVVFASGPVKGVPSVATSWFINSPKFNPNEPFPHVTNQIFGFDGCTEPTMTGFLQDYANLWDEEDWLERQGQILGVMETYRANKLPVLHSLARHYAVSDMWFSSVPTQTNPNRAFLICGTSQGQIINGPFGRSAFTADTIWNRLTELSPETSWGIFWHTANFPPFFPESFFDSPSTFSALDRIPDFYSHVDTIDRFHELARKGELPNFSFLEPQWTLEINLAQYHNLIPRDDEDIIGVQGNDLHPPGDVRTAENLLANLYTSLIANKEAWNHTLLVILFDEHGGLFDHVPPPAAVAPDDNFSEGFMFDRLGVRVPALFISPLINKGTVVRSDDPEIPFDHTSVISTLLQWKGISRADWNLGRRAAIAPTFDSVITREEPRGDAVLVPQGIILPEVDPHNVVQMGDHFCLRNESGEYISSSSWAWRHFGRIGSEDSKVALEFVGGGGAITHGSFVLVRSLDDKLEGYDLLETCFDDYYCFYNTNTHASGQWWTVKSVDHPYVGYEIQYGDRIYLENHVYLDLDDFFPCRLTTHEGFFGEFLVTRPISAENSANHFWTIERASSR